MPLAFLQLVPLLAELETKSKTTALAGYISQTPLRLLSSF
jgi:hypothetical protein